MAIYYMDPVGGNDTANGTTYALRKKMTLPTVAAGDTIRFIASADPVSIGNGTWVDAGNITLGSARTLDLYSNGAWVAATNVTATASTTRKEGANSTSLAVAAGWTAAGSPAGQVGYYATSSANASAYSKLALWFRSNTIVSNLSVFSLRLCSDAVGATAVNTLTFPVGNIVANQWIPLLLDNGGALHNDIDSIALYCSTDLGAITLLVDNVYATNDISSQHMISKSSAFPEAGGEPFYPIRSVSGTTVVLEYTGPNSSAATASKGYYGANETVETYLVKPISLPFSAAVGTPIYTIGTNGSAGNPVTISGGWAASGNMTTQSGFTWLGVPNGLGYGFDCGAKSYYTFDKLGLWGASRGWNVATISNFHWTNCASANCMGPGGWYISGITGNTVSFTNCYGTANAEEAIDSSFNFYYDVSFISCRADLCNNGFLINASISHGIGNLLVTDCMAVRCATTGMSISTAATGSVNNFIGVNNGAYGIVLGANAELFFNNVVLHNNTTAAVQVAAGPTFLVFNNLVTSGNTVGFNFDAMGGQRVTCRNWSFNEATPLGSPPAYQDSMLISVNDDGVAGNTVIRCDGGTISSDTTTRHTASGVSWKLCPTDSTRSASYPLVHHVGYFLCEENVAHTISVWCYRTNAGLTGTLRLKGWQLAGVDADVTDTVTTTGSWEELTLTFTPTESGFVEVQIEAYGGTTYALYWDDASISPVTTLDASSGDYAFYKTGVLLQSGNGTGSSGSQVAYTFAT